ncbi:MAG TPA: hypothetical protein VGC57_01820 [Cellulomonas sp.]
MSLPDALVDLPAGWRVVPLDLLGAGAQGLELVAAYETPDAGFTANITVGVQEPVQPAVVGVLGDAVVQHLRDAETGAVLRRREVLGAEPVPGLVQDVAFSTTVEGAEVAMLQTEAFVVSPHPDDAERVLVRTVTCTATAAQAGALADDVVAVIDALRP